MRENILKNCCLLNIGNARVGAARSGKTSDD